MLEIGWHTVKVEHFEGGGGANCVVWYKGADTDDKEVLLSDEIYHTHEQAKSVAESVKPAESNPGGATAGIAIADFLLPR